MRADEIKHTKSKGTTNESSLASKYLRESQLVLDSTSLDKVSCREFSDLTHSVNSGNHHLKLNWQTSVIQPDARRRFFENSTLLKSNIEYNKSYIKDLLPINLHVSGRIESEVALSYVKQIYLTSTSRSVIFISLSENPETVKDFDRLSQSLSTTRKWLVLAFDPSTSIRDMYLAPRSSIEDFLVSFEINPTDDDLILLIVVARGQSSTVREAQSALYDPKKSAY